MKDFINKHIINDYKYSPAITIPGGFKSVFNETYKLFTFTFINYDAIDALNGC